MAGPDPVEKQPAWTYESDAPIEHVAVAPAAGLLVVADKERNVRILDASGDQLGDIRPGQPVRGVACNRMGTKLAALSGERIVYAFDREGNLDWRVEFNGEITNFGFDPSGENVAAVTPEGWLFVYKEETRERLVVPVGVPMTDVCVVGEDPLQAVLATQKGNIALLDAEGATRWRRELEGPIGNAHLTVPGDLLVVAAGDQGIYLYHLDGAQIVNLDIEDLALKAMASDDGKHLMIHTGSGGMMLTDLEAEPEWQLPLDAPPETWSFGYQGSLLALVNADGVLEAYWAAQPPEPQPTDRADEEGEDDEEMDELRLEIEDMLADEDDLFADVPSGEAGSEDITEDDAPLVPSVKEGESGRPDTVIQPESGSSEPEFAPLVMDEEDITEEDITEEDTPMATAAPSASADMLWKLRLRANALPAAQSLFKVALDATYLVSVLTDGRLLVLSDEGKPVVKEEVGLPARIVPALPGRMVGTWTPRKMLIAQPTSGKTRAMEFGPHEVRSVDASDDFRIVAALGKQGILSTYIEGTSPVWQREVGEMADRLHVSPRGGTVLLKDRDGRFRYYTEDGHLKRKFRFARDAEGEVSAIAEDFAVFLRSGNRVTVLEHDGNEVFSGVLFKHTVGVELLGRQLAVYGPNGAAALLKPWEDQVHEMFPPPGKVRLRSVPGEDPVLIHVAGSAITAFTGYKRKLEVEWRFECHAPVEMAATDMDGRRVAALAADRLYWIGPPGASGH